MIQEIFHAKYRPGDFVVFRKTKRSTAPGPRAQHVAAAPHGEEYVYDVDKYWVVDEVCNGQIVVRTRRGKRHTLDSQDQRLRHARWWERVALRHRFPAPLENKTGMFSHASVGQTTSSDES